MPWKFAPILLAAILLSAVARGQEPVPPPAAPAPLPAATPASRPVIGLALEGGGALGLAHIGVLEWMEDNHIPVDRLAGTSMGALVGGLYASGMTPAQLSAVATSDAFTSVFTLQFPYADLSFRRRQDRREIPEALTVGLRHGPQLHNAVLSERAVDEFLVTNMSAYNNHELDFDNMPIPFRCVATDLNTLKAITFSRGPLPRAVRASISIPGLFPPVKGSEDHFLVDGGILDNLPTDVLRRDLKADIMIAVYLKSDTLRTSDTSTIVGVLNRAFSAGIEQNVALAEQLATLVVSVPLDDYSGTDYAKSEQIIHAGYLAAEQNRAAMLHYALNDQDWNAYIAARQERIRPQPGTLRELRVDGGSPGAKRAVVSDMKPLQGQPIVPDATNKALKPVQSNGAYAASYETFAPAGTAGSTAIGTPGAASDTGIIVRLTKDTIGPPYLIIGPELAAATSNISREEMNLRIVDQNLGGFGSETRGTAELGYRTALSVEYYRLLTPSGYFIEPRAGVLRQPVYIWNNQKRIAERFQQYLSTGLEIGRTFGNSLQVSAEWRAVDTRWALRTGSGGGPYITGTAQTGLLNINIDKASSGTISPTGFRLAASAGAFYHAAASSNAPMVQFSFNRTVSYKDTNIFGLGGEVDSYLRANVAQPFRFTLGGPMRLSAASLDEYRGTDMYLAHTGYMHRLAALPTGLGQGLYGLIGYEAGEVWSPEQRAFLRQDGSIGLVGNTPLGLVTFGVSAGDAGHRKVFLTLGRWF
ncbi:MAG TPA: patatin-like phospholipase family protein [Terracidiphilus sp.]|nr:patatin-like phospholipase family protein [Terracidiphilus sp.]